MEVAQFKAVVEQIFQSIDTENTGSLDKAGCRSYADQLIKMAKKDPEATMKDEKFEAGYAQMAEKCGSEKIPFQLLWGATLMRAQANNVVKKEGE